MKVLIATDERISDVRDRVRARARVLQDYGNVQIAEVEEPAVTELRALPGVMFVAEGRVEVPEQIDAAGRMAIEAWNAAQEPKVRKWDRMSWDKGDEEN